MLRQLQEQHDEADQKLAMLMKKHRNYIVDFPLLRGDKDRCSNCGGRTRSDCAEEYDLLNGKVTRLGKQIKEAENEELVKQIGKQNENSEKRIAQEKKEKEEDRLRALQLEEAELRLQLLKEQLKQTKK
jgi:hypothetical protein